MASQEVKKISDLPLSADVTSNDLLILVDIEDQSLSQSGRTKRVKVSTFSDYLNVSETDPVFTSSAAYNITVGNIQNWNAAYGWGDHSSAGYLTSFTESDPTFTSSPAYKVTNLSISNWNTAYGWGNHASAGYLKSYSEYDPVFQSSAAFAITTTKINNWDDAYGWGDHASAGYLKNISGSSFGDLSDTFISSPTSGQFLQFNGTNWVNFTPNFLDNYEETDTLQSVTARGASTDIECTFENVVISGNLSVVGTTTQNNVTTLNVSDNEIIINDGQTSGDLNAFITNDRGTDANVSIKWNEASNRWQFTNDGTNYYNLAINTSDLTNNSGFLTTLGSVGGHSDITLTSLASEDILIYNGSEWVNSPLDFNPRVFVSTEEPSSPVEGNLWWKSNDEVLKVYYNNGSQFQWADVSSGSGAGTGGIQSYASIAFFPDVESNEGEVVYSQANTALYLSDGDSWTNNRLVTTTNSTTSDLTTLIENTQLVYSTEVLDYTAGGSNAENEARKIIRLGDNKGNTSDAIINAGVGLNISRVENEIVLDVNVSDTTFGLSAVESDGSNSILRLSSSAESNDDILLQGADGVTIERVDENTLTFRGPGAGGNSGYTDEAAQDAAAALFINGDHTNISFVYNDDTNTINATAVTGAGSGGTTYDLLGSSTTSNNAFITLDGADGSSDAIEIAGGGGTQIAWDSDNDRITVSSTAPVQSDWTATSGLAQILNKPTIPDEYVLPIATAEALGGIKIGDNLTIDAQGVLSAVPGSYTLPTASAETLGGIKIGSGLSIDGNGIVSAVGGVTVPEIQDVSGSTSSLQPNSTAELNIIGHKAYSLFKITSSKEAWIRVYTDDASRDADLTRSEDEDPAAGTGVIAEIRTTGAESVLISPGIMGFNNDSPRTSNIYLSVTNRETVASAIDVTLTILQIGQ